MYSFVGVRPRESKSSRCFVLDTLWIIDVYFRAQLLKRKINSIVCKVLNFSIMTLSTQDNGTIGIFHMMLKVVSSEKLNPIWTQLFANLKRLGGGAFWLPPSNLAISSQKTMKLGKGILWVEIFTN